MPSEAQGPPPGALQGWMGTVAHVSLSRLRGGIVFQLHLL